MFAIRCWTKAVSEMFLVASKQTVAMRIVGGESSFATGSPGRSCRTKTRWLDVRRPSAAGQLRTCGDSPKGRGCTWLRPLGRCAIPAKTARALEAQPRTGGPTPWRGPTWWRHARVYSLTDAWASVVPRRGTDPPKGPQPRPAAPRTDHPAGAGSDWRSALIIRTAARLITRTGRPG